MYYRLNADDCYWEIIKNGVVVAKTTTETEAKTIIERSK